MARYHASSQTSQGHRLGFSAYQVEGPIAKEGRSEKGSLYSITAMDDIIKVPCPSSMLLQTNVIGRAATTGRKRADMTGRQTRKVAAVVGMMGFVMLTVGSRSQAQIAYIPGVGFIPSGQTMTVTPVVSADRRYVRLGVDASFNALNGFTAFNIPAAVGGGNFGGFGRRLRGDERGDRARRFRRWGNGFRWIRQWRRRTGLGGPATGLNAGSLAPGRGESLAGVYFGPPEGLIKGDPFSLDAIEKNREKSAAPFPVAEGDQRAAAGFPVADDGFAEDDVGANGSPPSPRRPKQSREQLESPLDTAAKSHSQPHQSEKDAKKQVSVHRRRQQVDRKRRQPVLARVVAAGHVLECRLGVAGCRRSRAARAGSSAGRAAAMLRMHHARLRFSPSRWTSCGSVRSVTVAG